MPLCTYANNDRGYHCPEEALPDQPVCFWHLVKKTGSLGGDFSRCFPNSESLEKVLQDSRHKKLIGFQIPGGSFKKARFPRVDFSGAMLDGANFEEAFLRESDFDNVSALGTCFDRAVLTRSRLTNTRLSEASFSGAYLNDCELTGCELGRNNFTTTQLMNAVFNGCRGSGMVWEEANLAHLALRKVDFAQLTVKFSQLLNAVFIDSNVRSSVFTDSALIACEWSNAVFEDCTFQNCDFRHAKFKASVFKRCAFQKADFNGAEFLDISWKDCRFNECVRQPLVPPEPNLSGHKG